MTSTASIGNATIALHLSLSRVDVTLNGDPRLLRGLPLGELGLTSIEDFGDSLDIFALNTIAEGTSGSFSLDDILVYQNRAISEPHALLLFALGAVLMVGRRERSKR